MSTYAIINSETNNCDNVIVLDEGSTWTPPSDHYMINIDGLSYGIGWHYDPATQVWTAAPSVEGVFNPNPVFVNSATVLSWTSQNADNVKLSTFGDQLFPANGSQEMTFTVAGNQSVTITVIGIAGETRTIVFVKVATTQAEMDSGPGVSVL
jgi:hypothetical protein